MDESASAIVVKQTGFSFCMDGFSLQSSFSPATSFNVLKVIVEGEELSLGVNFSSVFGSKMKSLDEPVSTKKQIVLLQLSMPDKTL